MGAPRGDGLLPRRGKLIRTIPAGAYFPKPKVDSALVRLVPKERPKDWARIKKAIDALFIHPGKTVKAAARGSWLAGKVPEELEKKRVRELTPADIEKLAIAD
jgi:16S rRNA A1518/A1519 N6-dimethyltransferase RsmA/KsgA/DIM1 with predicted DNA glycosylase/AP lyase activity